MTKSIDEFEIHIPTKIIKFFLLSVLGKFSNHKETIFFFVNGWFFFFEHFSLNILKNK